MDADRAHGFDHADAALKLLRIEGCEDVAELVVRERADPEGPQATQQFQLLLAELGDLDPASTPRSHTSNAASRR